MNNNNTTNKNINRLKLIELQNILDCQTNLINELIKQNNNLELKLNKLEKVIMKREEAKTKGWIF
tara:strand:- start:646 stop:840 length:195 start_codon:yes stop_codon:yes gene_type:complete